MTLRLRTRTRIAAVLCVVLGTCAVARAQSGTTPSPVAELPYTIAPLGGISIATMGTGPLGAGYARIVATSGNTTPAGLVIFGFRQNGILVSEAGVPASALILTGRIYAEVSGAVNTGLALANPNGQPATINFFFTDAAGGSFGAGSTTVAANGQIAGFLNQAPFNGASNINGTFTFTSNVPVGVIAFRGLSNERGEFLITTLPVADLSQAAGTQTVLFPHFADGGGWTTQVVLVNSSDQESLSGTVQFVGQGTASAPAEPVPVTIGGVTASSFNYTIPARSSRVLRTSNPAGATLAGSVRITPQTGARAPSGLGIFSFKLAGVTVTEAGVVAAAPATAQRMYAESSGAASGSIQTGVAVANSKIDAVNVDFSLTRLDGSATGLSARLTVPGNGGQVAVFLNQIPGFQTLPVPFQGVLRIASTTTTGVAVVGLRGRTNERGEFLITTTPPVDENAPASAAELFFPHFADGGGYTTQFILSSGSTQASIGTLKFFGQSGGALALSLAPPGPAGPLSTYTLSTSTAGTGSGVISPAGGTYASGTVATLTATPNTGSTFSGWSGACSGTATACTVTMNANKSVGAVFSASVQVSISPTSTTVQTGGTRQFTGTVIGTTNNGVTWSVSGIVGGNAAVGTISTSGLYVAPAVVPSPNTVIVNAKSVQDPSKSAAASITITQSLTIEVTPGWPAVSTGGKVQFTAVAKDPTGSLFSPQPVFAWSSSVTTVAAINNDGLAQAGSAGLTTIRASAAGISSSPVTLTVTTDPLTLKFQSAVIGSTGGTVTLTDGSKIIIDPGILKDNTTVTAAVAQTPTSVSLTPGTTITSQTIILQIPSLAFATPANPLENGIAFQIQKSGIASKLVRQSDASTNATSTEIPLTRLLVSSGTRESEFFALKSEAGQAKAPVAIMVPGDSFSVSSSVNTYSYQAHGVVHAEQPLPIQLRDAFTNTPVLEADLKQIQAGKVIIEVPGYQLTPNGNAMANKTTFGAINASLPNTSDVKVLTLVYPQNSGNVEIAVALQNYLDAIPSSSKINMVMHSRGGQIGFQALLAGFLVDPSFGDRFESIVSLAGALEGTRPRAQMTASLVGSKFTALGLTDASALGTLDTSGQNLWLGNFGSGLTTLGEKHPQLFQKVHLFASTEKSDILVSEASSVARNLRLPIPLANITYSNYVGLQAHSYIHDDPAVINTLLALWGLGPPLPPTSPATIAVSTNALVFSASESGSNPGSQNFTIRNAGPAGSTLNYQVSASVPWIGLSGPIRQLSSGDSEFFTVSINKSGFTAGTYGGTITVADSNSTNKEQTINVTLTITSAATFVLTVAKTGTGTGTVTATANPPNPGPTYPAGTVVTLTATPASGSTFTGWGGACSGTGQCTLTMNSNKSVTATFSATPPPSNRPVLDLQKDCSQFKAALAATNSDAQAIQAALSSPQDIQPYDMLVIGGALAVLEHRDRFEGLTPAEQGYKVLLLSIRTQLRSWLAQGFTQMTITNCQ